MPRTDFKSPRLYVDHPLRAGDSIMLDKSQAHYLADVLRQRPGDAVLVFNGQDGEWRARLEQPSKKSVALALDAQTRAQTPANDLHYLFAPLKRARLDYMVQKAVEMGVSKLQPVLTAHTQAERVNTDRMRANAIEAAEQCGILNLAEIAAPLPLPDAIAALEPARVLIFCDEAAPVAEPVRALAEYRQNMTSNMRCDTRNMPKLAVIIGPEGGFATAERELLMARANTIRLALGPRILRADTAAVAALALVQAALGDWS